MVHALLVAHCVIIDGALYTIADNNKESPGRQNVLIINFKESKQK